MSLNLHSYLGTNFPELKIRKPLFYSWDIGLRFELGPPDSEYNEEYFKETITRAEHLYCKAFEAEEEVIVVYQEFSFKKQRIKKSNFLFSQIGNIDFSTVIFSREKDLYGDERRGEYWRRVYFKTNKCNINYHNILQAIANTDFGDRHPRLLGDLYFIGIKTNIIFHMYDDRGLDIIASDKNSLSPIYNEFNKWILDYDRERIDQTFNT